MMAKNDEEEVSMEPTLQAISALKKASSAASSPAAQTLIDRMTGFRISKWKAEGQVVQRQILDEYEEAKNNGVQSIAKGTELRQAANLINIATKSTKYLNQKKEYQQPSIENDFFWNTVEYAKTISDEEVQELLAKILAGEYDKEGSYTMQTLQIMKSLDRELIKKFKNLLAYVISDGQLPEKIYRLDSDYRERPSYVDLLTLQTVGLVQSNTTLSKTPKSEFLGIRYQKKILVFKTDNPDEKATIQIPSFYSLSPSGVQLAKILDPDFIESYFEWLKNKYKLLDYKFFKVED